MTKRLILVIILFFLVISLNSFPFSKIIIAPVDYPTITECVWASSPGDIIFILPGKYLESFGLTEGISLIGARPENTIIWWDKLNPVIAPGNNTLISGFKIEKGWFGFELNYLNNVEINGNIIKEGSAGVFTNHSKNIRIKNNIIDTNEFGHGIPGVYNENLIISNNIIYGCEFGTCIHESDIYMAYNTISFNAGAGIGVPGCSGQILNNIISENNKTDPFGGVVANSSNIFLDYNNVWQGDPQIGHLYMYVEPGPHDISIDPQFVNPENEDFHLQETSPCLTASSEGGEIGAYGNGGMPGVGIKLPLLQQMEVILRVMDYLSDDCFEKPNYKKVLMNKFEVIERNLGRAEDSNNKGLYQSTLNIVNNTILPRTDGCEISGNPDENDWITDCRAQEWMYSLLLNLIETLEKKLQ